MAYSSSSNVQATLRVTLRFFKPLRIYFKLLYHFFSLEISTDGGHSSQPVWQDLLFCWSELTDPEADLRNCLIENFVMSPYPTFNGKTINRPRGEEMERLIGMQLWSFNQQKLTLPVLCFIHICVYEIAIDCFNYMRSWTIALSQLMCYSESTFVKIIQVVSGVKNLVFRQLLFHHIPL